MFRFGGVAIRVSAAHSSLVLWSFLDMYFSPYFEMVDSTGDALLALDVEVVIGACESRIDARQCSEVEVDRSGGFLRCKGFWIDRGSTRMVHLDPFAVDVCIDRERRRAVVTGQDELTLRVPLLRIIEDACVAALESRGAVFIHASAVAVGAKAILLVGNKGSGKTTSLCRLLKLFDVSKLANDNVVLWLEDASVIVRGWPSFFKVAAATVATQEELTHLFPSALRHLLDHGDQLWKVYEKIAIYPTEAAELFDRQIQPQAVISTIILPRFGKDLVPRLTTISRDELCDEIGLYIQGSQNPNYTDWMGLGTVDRDSILAQLINMLIAPSTMTALRMEWAPALDDLLTDVPDLRPRRSSLQASADPAGRASKWPALPAILKRPE
ncbi:hypothetical protein RPC_3877 [Rhodopseudomonas palustris BisB18]|uniref:HPr kinase n=1 Tax=Rhodopseudomonas palustris (strain BisB18) TaxID=316056 RepID=Q20ZN0_RHOPB